jgi:tetraacyldisaccharide-1-P 4'-kinase
VLDEVAYPDHYTYSEDDVGTLRERAIERKAEVVLTTEKDAAKIRPYLALDDGSWWAARRCGGRTGESVMRKMILTRGQQQAGESG